MLQAILDRGPCHAVKNLLVQFVTEIRCEGNRLTWRGGAATSLPRMGLLSRLLGTEGATRDLLADLSEDYRAEAAQAVLLRAHAERARYPQAASALRALAEMEDRHAEWLRTRLLALGGQPPAAGL